MAFPFQEAGLNVLEPVLINKAVVIPRVSVLDHTVFSFLICFGLSVMGATAICKQKLQ